MTTTQANAHTPGPWAIVGFTTSCGVTIRTDPKVRKQHDSAEGALVAMVKHIMRPEPDANGQDVNEAEANARLIAAAPDLLDALCLALPYAEAELELNREAYKPGVPARVLATIRAAIAKAEGGK